MAGWAVNSLLPISRACTLDHPLYCLPEASLPERDASALRCLLAAFGCLAESALGTNQQCSTVEHYKLQAGASSPSSGWAGVATALFGLSLSAGTFPSSCMVSIYFANYAGRCSAHRLQKMRGYLTNWFDCHFLKNLARGEFLSYCYRSCCRHSHSPSASWEPRE